MWRRNERAPQVTFVFDRKEISEMGSRTPPPTPRREQVPDAAD